MNHCSATVNLSGKLPAARQPRDLDGQFFASVSCTKGSALLWTFLLPIPLLPLVPLGLDLCPGAYDCDGSNGPSSNYSVKCIFQGLLKPLYPLGALSFKAQCFKIQTQHQNHYFFYKNIDSGCYLILDWDRDGPQLPGQWYCTWGFCTDTQGSSFFYTVCGLYVGTYTWSFLSIPE